MFIFFLCTLLLKDATLLQSQPGHSCPNSRCAPFVLVINAMNVNVSPTTLETPTVQQSRNSKLPSDDDSKERTKAKPTFDTEEPVRPVLDAMEAVMLRIDADKPVKSILSLYKHTTIRAGPTHMTYHPDEKLELACEFRNLSRMLSRESRRMMFFAFVVVV